MQGLTPVNHTQVTEVWNIYRTNPTVKACTDLLKRAMLVGGMHFPKSQDGEYDTYMALASSAMDWLLCVGVIPVTSKQHKVTGKWIPVCPDVSAVRLMVQVNEVGECEYSATFRNQGALNGHMAAELWVWAQAGPTAP
jgi:hypothetical protein